MLGHNVIMAGVNDLREACYTSPSGKKFYFNYDSKLSSETDLKTVTFTFPDKDGALVIPLGLGGRNFSFLCNFFGSDCLKKVDEFEEGLKEKGYGELVHPLYGVHKVVPTGSISRSDDVISGINVSSISVTFAETLIDGKIFVSENILKNEINDNLEEFEKKSTWEYIKNFTNNRVQDIIWASATFKKGIEIITNELQKITQIEKKINIFWNELESELLDSVDTFAKSIEKVAIQSIKLIRLPANTDISVIKKYEGYYAACVSIIKNFKNDPVNLTNAKNQWRQTKLFLESLTVACAEGVSNNLKSENNNFKSRDEAIKTATGLANMYDLVVNFEDSKVSKNFFVESGESFNLMRDIVFKSIKLIVDYAFSLKTRKTIILMRDKQILDLLYEIYGGLDKIDEFIVDNKINYNEIEIIPMGREISYYE